MIVSPTLLVTNLVIVVIGYSPYVCINLRATRLNQSFSSRFIRQPIVPHINGYPVLHIAFLFTVVNIQVHSYKTRRAAPTSGFVRSRSGSGGLKLLGGVMFNLRAGSPYL